MDDDNIDREVKQALEERLEWINGVTEDAAAGNYQAVQEAIDQLDDQDLRKVVYVLVLARGADIWAMREYLAKNSDDGPTRRPERQLGGREHR